MSSPNPFMLKDGEVFERPNIFDEKKHLCPKCNSRLWITEKYSTVTESYIKKCKDCFHTERIKYS